MSKTVLITGGNRGIGLEVTRLFLEKGYDIIVVARNFENFEFNDNKNVRTINFDVSNIDEIPGLISKLGDIDILINNAGVMYSVPYDNYPKDKVDSMIKINVMAPVAFITEVSKSMIKNGSGRIVSTASVAGQIGHPDIWYGVTKAGLINATKSFAKLLAPKGIVINAVAPGPVITDMLNTIPEARKKFMLGNVYINRFAYPKEVARTIYWLATESPEYINGTCIDINNGSFPR